jgi:hypothetical protein
MRNPLINLQCQDTYYLANFISNLLRDRWTYLRTLHEFFEDDACKVFLAPYQKYSALHRFAEFCALLLVSDNSEEYTEFIEDLSRPVDHLPEDFRPKMKLSVNYDLDRLGIDYLTLTEWLESEGKTKEELDEDALCEYMDELTLVGTIEELVVAKAEEAFFLLFLNRDVLHFLNLLIASYIEDLDWEELDQDERTYFERPRVLKRVAPPQWVRRAVLYRDRGMCALCGMDISGLLNISTIENFDHIVPLAQGGLNDITNIQLLCEGCNKAKGHGESITSSKYERWYEPEDSPY